MKKKRIYLDRDHALAADLSAINIVFVINSLVEFNLLSFKKQSTVLNKCPMSFGLI